MLLIYSDPVVWEALTEAERASLGPEHAALIGELEASGEWVGGSVLAPPERSRAVRVRNGAVQVVDGPFAEVKEHLAGYDIVDCDGMERAAEIAARIPDARLARVEIRPMVGPEA
ncbi:MULTISPECIES: YciI family protein [Streptomycetaceae]|nr:MULTISPECIES: YciI family protein [Streptomycetaceae]